MTNNKGYSASEKAYRDRFHEAYMGKEYMEGPLAATELMTVGLEALRYRSWSFDAEYRHFVLGVLALL